MRITVTQQDIDKGEQGEAKHCPIARALKRATGEQCLVASKICFIGDREDIPLPENAQSFVSDFDCGFPVKPFSFDLDF